MHTLSVGATFEYGIVGALAGLLVVQALPVFLALARGESQLRIGFLQVFGCACYVLGYIACGGLAAILVGDATLPKHAIAYGLGWQSIIGGYMNNPFSAA